MIPDQPNAMWHNGIMQCSHAECYKANYAVQYDGVFRYHGEDHEQGQRLMASCRLWHPDMLQEPPKQC